MEILAPPLKGKPQNHETVLEEIRIQNQCQFHVNRRTPNGTYGGVGAGGSKFLLATRCCFTKNLSKIFHMHLSVRSAIKSLGDKKRQALPGKVKRRLVGPKSNGVLEP